MSLALAPAATFTASLDRDAIVLGESATLSLTFEGVSPKSSLALPAIPNLRAAFSGQSSSFNMVNGRTSSSVTYTYVLTPTQPGEIEIPSLSVNLDGKDLISQPLKLKVGKPGAAPVSEAEAAAQVAFVRLRLQRSAVFAGEIVPIELQIYLSDAIQNIGNFQVTSMPAEGCTVGKTVEGQRRREQVGNRIFNVIPLTIVLQPAKTGSLTIGPITCVMDVQLPAEPGARAMDPFGFFNRTQTRRLSLATDAATLQCRPLPAESVPATFSGAVGSYNMAASVGPTNVAVGDPVTVKIQITGSGDFGAITLPAQPAWHDFKTYPPTSRVETTDGLGLQGTKWFEQVVVPQNAEVKELPAFSFSFFDPETRNYRTLIHPAVPLIVRPSGSSPLPSLAGPLGASEEEAPPAQDIVSIKQRLGTVTTVQSPWVKQPWFLGLQAVPVLAWAGLVVWRKRADTLANNPRLRRQLRVEQLTREGLEQLRRLAAENKSDEFFATLFHLLQEQLGERLDLPASAITEAVVDEHLARRNLQATTVAALRELFQLCNLARYAPIKSGQELAAVIPKLESALREVQKLQA